MTLYYSYSLLQHSFTFIYMSKNLINHDLELDDEPLFEKTTKKQHLDDNVKTSKKKRKNYIRKDKTEEE